MLPSPPLRLQILLLGQNSTVAGARKCRFVGHFGPPQPVQKSQQHSLQPQQSPKRLDSKSISSIMSSCTIARYCTICKCKQAVMRMRNLKRFTLGESAYATIKEAILSGELPAGSRVTEKMLEDALGVSRSPIRDAMARLAQEGYLIGKSYKGYRVNHPTLKEIKDVHEVIFSLVSTSFDLAMQRADETQINELAGLADQAEVGLEDSDITKYVASLRELRHNAALWSQNEVLLKLYEQMVNHPAYIRLWAMDNPESARRRAPDFQTLRASLRRRDGATASRVMIDHLKAGMDEVAKAHAKIGEKQVTENG